MVAELLPLKTRNTGGLVIVSTPRWDDLKRRLREYSPKSDLGQIVKSCFSWLPPDLAGELLEAITRSVILQSALSVVTFAHPDNGGRVLDYGVTSRKVITTAGVGFLVDAWQNSLELEIMKYHGIGTSNQAEAAADTALITECTTALNPDSTRATGSTEEGASANIFKTIGTNTVDSVVTIQEHGIFSQAATGGGVLWDRSLTGGNALGSGDSIQTTYQMTATAGG